MKRRDYAYGYDARRLKYWRQRLFILEETIKALMARRENMHNGIEALITGKRVCEDDICPACGNIVGTRAIYKRVRVGRPIGGNNDAKTEGTANTGDGGMPVAGRKRKLRGRLDTGAMLRVVASAVREA